jgi:hypothetical protein
MYAFDRLRRINAAAEPPDSLRSDAPGNDAMPASDDYATAPTPKKRLRPASKRLSRCSSKMPLRLPTQ